MEKEKEWVSERGRVKWRRGTVLKVTLRVDTEQETMFDVAVSRKLNPLKTAIEGPTHYAKIYEFLSCGSKDNTKTFSE